MEHAMIKRMGVVNKNILALFVRLANELAWPIYLEHYDRLKKDKSFPEMLTYIGDQADGFYQLEKRNGQWQVQFVEDIEVIPVTRWATTKKFEENLEFALEVAKEIKKRGQSI
jgi:hypothetical protein